jgi:hypothetical protein
MTYLRNRGKRWESRDAINLKAMLTQETPMPVIVQKLGRSKRAIKDKIKREPQLKKFRRKNGK